MKDGGRREQGYILVLSLILLVELAKRTQEGRGESLLDGVFRVVFVVTVDTLGKVEFK